MLYRWLAIYGYIMLDGYQAFRMSSLSNEEIIKYPIDRESMPPAVYETALRGVENTLPIGLLSWLNKKSHLTYLQEKLNNSYGVVPEP
jgi:hypothetical protein